MSTRRVTTHAIVVLLLVGAGAIVNVAVAWGVPAFVRAFTWEYGWPLLAFGKGFQRAYTIWPGFAINTVFYAATLWLLFAAPFALRKWRRIKHGLCPKCGYDLRGGVAGSAVCPECGAAVFPRP
jgi:hypothetical protein